MSLFFFVLLALFVVFLSHPQNLLDRKLINKHNQIEIGFHFRRRRKARASTLLISQERAVVQSNHSAMVQVLNSPREDERIEVAIENQTGTERVVLRHSTWTEGLGWCSQKTIRLDSDQIDDLHRALTVARHRINRQRAETGQFKDAAQVIQLPTLA